MTLSVIWWPPIIALRKGLLDHLVGEPLYGLDDGQPERLGGIEVDHQLELEGARTGEFIRLPAVQDGSALIDAMTLGKSSREV
jgi:hypothetical protein